MRIGVNLKIPAVDLNKQLGWISEQIRLVILRYHQLSQKASASGGFGHAKGVIEKNPKAIFFQRSESPANAGLW